MPFETILFKFIHYGNLIFGVDQQFLQTSNTQGIAENRFYKIYKNILNIIIISYLPIYLLYGQRFLDKFSSEKPLLPILNRLNVYCQCLVAILSVWYRQTNLQLQQDLVELMNKFQVSTVPRYVHLLWLKIIWMIAQALSPLVPLRYISDSKHQQTWLDFSLVVYYSIIYTMLHLLLYQLLFTLWKVVITLEDIKIKFLDIFQRHTKNILDIELLPLMQRLELSYCICLKLMAYYQFYAITWLLILVVNNAIAIYFIFLLIATSKTISKLFIVFSIWTLLTKLMDAYMLLMMCDFVKAKQMEVRQILGERINDSREIFDFLLRNALKRSSFQVYGMFALGKTLALTIVVSAIMQITIVIQFDYILKVK